MRLFAAFQVDTGSRGRVGIYVGKTDEFIKAGLQQPKVSKQR